MTGCKCCYFRGVELLRSRSFTLAVTRRYRRRPMTRRCTTSRCSSPSAVQQQLRQTSKTDWLATTRPAFSQHTPWTWNTGRSHTSMFLIYYSVVCFAM